MNNNISNSYKVFSGNYAKLMRHLAYFNELYQAPISNQADTIAKDIERLHIAAADDREFANIKTRLKEHPDKVAYAQGDFLGGVASRQVFIALQVIADNPADFMHTNFSVAYQSKHAELCALNIYWLKGQKNCWSIKIVKNTKARFAAREFMWLLSEPLLEKIEAQLSRKKSVCLESEAFLKKISSFFTAYLSWLNFFTHKTPFSKRMSEFIDHDTLPSIISADDEKIRINIIIQRIRMIQQTKNISGLLYLYSYANISANIHLLKKHMPISFEEAVFAKIDLSPKTKFIILYGYREGLLTLNYLGDYTIKYVDATLEKLLRVLKLQSEIDDRYSIDSGNPLKYLYNLTQNSNDHYRYIKRYFSDAERVLAIQDQRVGDTQFMTTVDIILDNALNGSAIKLTEFENKDHGHKQVRLK